jgi:hypothetical protein
MSHCVEPVPAFSPCIALPPHSPARHLHSPKKKSIGAPCSAGAPCCPSAERLRRSACAPHRYVAIWGITDARRICERVGLNLDYGAGLADRPVLQPLRPVTSSDSRAPVPGVAVAVAQGVL